MAKTMATDVAKSQANMITIGNARRLADIEYLSKMPGFVLIAISAEMHIRYERTKTRGEKASDATQTFEQFVADHERSTELSIAEVAKQATEQIDNNGTKEELCTQLDNLMKKYS
jgi:dephospho-CoA kinase